ALGRGTHLDGEAARQFATGALQQRANIFAEALAECPFEDVSALLFRRYQGDYDARERKHTPASRDHLHLAFDLFQDRAMQQQSVAGFRRAEHTFGPAPESALDTFFDFP